MLEMTDDTRDIALTTREDVKHLTEQVAKLVTSVDELRMDVAERRGMEKLAGAIKAAMGGVTGSGFTLALAKYAALWPPK